MNDLIDECCEDHFGKIERKLIPKKITNESVQTEQWIL